MADTPNFCTQCGSPLEKNQNFCTHCGHAVDTTMVIPTTSQQAAKDNQNADATMVMPAAASTTAASVQQTYSQPDPHASGVSESTPHQPTASNENQKQPMNAKTKRNIMIGIIIALGVIILALVGFLIFSNLTNNKTDETSQQTTTQEEQKQASSQADSTSSSTQATSTATSARDKAIYNDLITYYNNLETYDSKISTAATNFNNNYLKKDSSLRSRYKSDATSLLNAISADYNALFDLNVSSSSEYYDCYDKLLTCYYDCKMRISVICDSWSNSLRYSDPTGHETEICEPLERDRVDGNNKYYTEFNQLYPSAQPAAPRS